MVFFKKYFSSYNFRFDLNKGEKYGFFIRQKRYDYGLNIKLGQFCHPVKFEIK